MLGTSQRFNMTANIGYHISDISVDNQSQGSAASYTFSNIIQAHTIFANFAINQYNLNVTQTSNGIIEPETSVIDYGDTPTFTITPTEGYYITNITANGQSIPVVSSSGQTYQFGPVTANGSLNATFAIRKFTIQVSHTENGTITPGKTTVSYNDSQTFTITPDIGCHVVDVLVNGKSIGPISSYVAQNIQSSITISATFASDPTPIPTPTPSTTPTPNPSTQTSTIMATNEKGAKINLSISGNITSQQITNATITPNKSSKTIAVSFTISGDKGDTGLGNVTIPKKAVNFGTSPIGYIDGIKAVDQGYSEDDENYYVWFTTHFSNHDISLVFSSPISNSELLSQTTIYIVSGVVLVMVIISGIVIYKNRYYLQDKFENIKIF